MEICCVRLSAYRNVPGGVLMPNRPPDTAAYNTIPNAARNVRSLPRISGFCPSRRFRTGGSWLGGAGSPFSPLDVSKVEP